MQTCCEAEYHVLLSLSCPHPQVLSPTYKQRNEDFRKLFKKLPDTERLIVGEWDTCMSKTCLRTCAELVSYTCVTTHSRRLNIHQYPSLKNQSLVEMIPDRSRCLSVHWPLFLSWFFPQTTLALYRRTYCCRAAFICQRIGSVSTATSSAGKPL